MGKGGEQAAAARREEFLYSEQVRLVTHALFKRMRALRRAETGGCALAGLLAVVPGRCRYSMLGLAGRRARLPSQHRCRPAHTLVLAFARLVLHARGRSAGARAAGPRA